MEALVNTIGKYLKLNITLNIHAAGYFPCLRAAKFPYFKEFSTIENGLGLGSDFKAKFHFVLNIGTTYFKTSLKS